MELPDSLPVIVEYYREFRTALFLSSLTLGTFLFTMKTFIVQTMKKDVYDDDEYQEEVRYRRSQGLVKETYYGSLRRFSWLIVASIALAFISALAQISLGYASDSGVIWVCLFLAASSWCLVASVLFLVSNNLSTMLDRAERKTMEKLEKGEFQNPENAA